MEAKLGEGGKVGEITSELVRLNESKEQLHNSVEALIERLKDLLREPDPSTDMGSDKRSLSSPFAIDLSSISATIEADLEKVNDTILRLEL